MDPTVTFGFAALLVAHAAIHVGVFVRAFRLADVHGLDRPMSPATGAAWLAVAVAFVATAVIFLAGRGRWRLLAGAAACASQILVFARFGEVGMGTIGNLLVVLAMALLR